MKSPIINHCCKERRKKFSTFTVSLSLSLSFTHTHTPWLTHFLSLSLSLSKHWLIFLIFYTHSLSLSPISHHSHHGPDFSLPRKNIFPHLYLYVLFLAQPFDTNECRQWLWLSWQSGRFWYQRSGVRIQTLAIFIEHLFTANCIVLKRRK